MIDRARRVVAQIAADWDVLAAFVVSRALVWAVAKLSWEWIKHGDSANGSGSAIWDLLQRWDAGWYRSIAQHGYSYAPGHSSNVAFFPLYPFCVGAIQYLTGGSFAFTAFALSNICLFVAVLCLRRLAALDFPAPSPVPARTVWLVLLFPVTFFFSAPYAESMCLMLATGALLAARRGEWGIAAITSAFLTAAHSLGVVILLPLVWEAVMENNAADGLTRSKWGIVRHSRWWLVIAPAGLVSFAVFLHQRFGDALAFLHVQSSWGRAFYYPWKSLALLWAYRSNSYGSFLIAVVLLALLAMVLGWRAQVRRGYLLYAAAILGIILSQTTYEALARHVSVIFPLPLALAAAARGKDWLFHGLLAAGATLLGLCTTLYVCGYWMT